MRALFLLLLMLCGLAATPRSQTLQLASGELLLAEVEDATGEGLRVKRLDNGGVLELRWDHLTPTCALRVKQAVGLAGEDQGELTATVLEVRFLAGGLPRSVIGRRDDELSDQNHLVVRQKGQPFKVAIADLLEVREIEVPVTQVFTLDEFYSQDLQKIAPGDNPDLHVLLAEDLIKVRDYDRAAEHLQQARQLQEEHGTSRAPEQIERLMARLGRYREAKKELDLIDEIKVARARGTAKEFVRGLERIAKYEKEFAAGKLRGDFETEKRRFAEARTRFYSQQVAEAWRRAISYVAERKVQEPGITLDVIREFAEKEMGDAIAADVAERFELTVEEVREFWDKRKDYPIGKRSDSFTYGVGSWVLGKDGVTKDVKNAKPIKAEDPTQSRELDRVARDIRRMLQDRRAAANAGGGQVEPQTPDEWWAEAARQERVSWLRAYYAEFGGDLVMRIAGNQPCLACSGSGSVLVPGPGNKVISIDCYLCHGTRFLRSFKAW